MKNNTEEAIIQREKEYWNEGKLERTRIKKIRRHAFYFSYQKEKRILKEISKSFSDKNLLEIGSHSWPYFISNDTPPKKLTCINISEEELKKGKLQGERYQFNIEFHMMNANNLKFADNTFDVVYGGAILHHLNIEKSMDHIHRVLKPNGVILFLEPLNINPIYKLYRRLTPKERTPDEHALVSKDLKCIGNKFSVSHYYMDFFTVIFGLIALKIYGDKNYDNWINKTGFKLDNFFSRISVFQSLFARIIIYGKKRLTK